MMASSKIKLVHWIEHHPFQVSMLAPWFLGVLPISLLPTDLFIQLGGLALVREVADFAPMVRYMSARAADPAWTQKMLACMWAMSPLWIVSTVFFFFLSLRAGVAKRREAHIGTALLVGAFFFVLALGFAHVRGATRKRSGMLELLFISDAGVFFVGWFCISFPFVVLGLLMFIALTRPTGEKNG
jgi:hypothetical protein